MTDPLQSREAPCPHCAGKGVVTIPPFVATVEAYYFGCHRDTGHHWFDRHQHSVGFDRRHGLLRPLLHRIDTGFCPPHEKVGHAALHHVDGWTVLALWDRSVDKRGQSNSAFVAKGEHSFAVMLAIAGAQFPWVVGRPGFPNVVLVEGGAP